MCQREQWRALLCGSVGCGLWRCDCGCSARWLSGTSGHREMEHGSGPERAHSSLWRRTELDRSVSWNGVNCNRDTAGQLLLRGDPAPLPEKHLVPGSALDHVHQQKRVLALLHPQRVAGRPLLPVLRWLSAHLPTSFTSGSSFLFPAVSFKGYLRYSVPGTHSTLSSLITHISCSFMVVWVIS